MADELPASKAFKIGFGATCGVVAALAFLFIGCPVLFVILVVAFGPRAPDPVREALPEQTIVTIGREDVGSRDVAEQDILKRPPVTVWAGDPDRERRRQEIDDIAAASERARAAEEAQVEKLEQAERAAAEQAEQDRLAAIEEAKYRDWTSANGKFKLRAKLVAHGSGRVTLVDRAGKRSMVEVAKLSDADRDFVAAWQKERRK